MHIYIYNICTHTGRDLVVQLVRSCPCMQCRCRGTLTRMPAAASRRATAGTSRGNWRSYGTACDCDCEKGSRECNACMRCAAAGETSGRPRRRQTAQRTRAHGATERDGPTAHGPAGERARQAAGGRRQAGSWRNERPMWRCTYVISFRSIHPSCGLRRPGTKPAGGHAEKRS